MIQIVTKVKIVDYFPVPYPFSVNLDNFSGLESKYGRFLYEAICVLRWNDSFSGKTEYDLVIPPY